MGNLQGSEGKHSKTGKSPGKSKNLIKNKKSSGKENKSRKKSEINDNNSCLQESTENILGDSVTAEKYAASNSAPKIEISTLSAALGTDNTASAGGSRSTNRELLALQGDQNKAVPSLDNSNNKNNIITDSWRQINKASDVKKCGNTARKDLKSPSKESSSESVFTDPLTPVGFAAEINQCYYSEESVNVHQDDVQRSEEGKSDVHIHNSKENERPTREKLGKLSISKVSCVSSDDNLDENIDTNILCLSHIMPDTCLESFMNSNLEVMKQNIGVHSPITVSPDGKHSSGNNNNMVAMDIADKRLSNSSESQNVNNNDDMGSFISLRGNKDTKRDEKKTDKDGEVKMKATTPVTSFTLSRHKKVDLQPSILSEECFMQDEVREHRRHASLSDGPPLTGDSNVLRKVASLTMDRATLEAKILKPKFVPEKLNFQMYEKFEGQMLVNWFVSAFSDDHYLRSVVSQQDLRILGTQYCTHLLAAGVLRQIPDKDAPSDHIFRPDLMYYWTHMETPSSVPITPGRLQHIAWPPTQDIPHNQKPPDPLTPTRKKTALNLECNKINDENIIINEAINLRLKQFNQEDPATVEKGIDNKEINKYVQRISELEDVIKSMLKELDRYKTLAGIQSLTENALRDFDSPKLDKDDSNKFKWENSGVEKTDDEKFGKIERAEPFFNNDDISGPCEMLSSQNLIKSYDELCMSTTEKERHQLNASTMCQTPSPPPMPETDVDSNYPSLPPPPAPEELTNCENIHTKKVLSPRVSPTKSSLNSFGTPPKTLQLKKENDINTRTSQSKLNQQLKNSRISPKKGSPIKTVSNHPHSPTKVRSGSQSPLSDKTSPLSKRSPPRTLYKSGKHSPLSPDNKTPNFVKSNSSERVLSSGLESSLNKNNLSRKSSLTDTNQEGKSSIKTPKSSPNSTSGYKNNSSPTNSSAKTINASPEAILTSCKSEVTSQPSGPEMSSVSSSESIPPPLPISGGPPPPPLMPGMGPPPPPPPMPGMGPPPPPPMPGMGPPLPPPMPGMGPPPPPPMPGMGPPPPPPMPGMGPPPPPPMPGMGPPPPPPMPGMGPPPPPPMPGMGPPPPPPMPGMGPPPPPMPGAGPPPPPPPGLGPPLPPGMVPPPPPGLGPIPFPAPPAGGWDPNKATLRKKPLNPPIPMKPLYWTRILALPAASPIPTTPDDESPPEVRKPLWLEIDETSLPNIDEFADLFSRQVITRKPTNKKKVEKSTKVQSAKILDGKRFQSVGILAQSLQVDFTEIENAIYNFDTTTVNLDALQQIYEARATEEELSKIKDHLQNHPEIPLDKPETFLLELSEIQSFTERISCFTFQAEFDDSIRTITSKLDNIWRVCEFLITSEGLKKLFSIILTLGNYMNGGNRQRGQADGFGLEILSKLLDVKSKDSSVTLLHFIVKTYMNQMDDTVKSTLPIPEPGDISRASFVLFEDIKHDLDMLHKLFEGCKNKTKKVISDSSKENLQPFKDKMTAFLETAGKQLTTETTHLQDCQSKFVVTMKFYQYTPKSGTLNDCSPKEFFDLWSQFCADFKDIWKKEEQKRLQELSKKVNTTKKERTNEIQKVKKKEGGLKAKIEKLRKS